MEHHPRAPAAVILALAATVAVGMYFTLGNDPAKARAGMDLPTLEQRIAAGNVAPDVWFSYGDALAAQNRHAHAALAYKKGLEKEPYARQARLNCASALALASNADSLLAFLKDLTASDAKLAVDVFERRECQGFMKDPRFASLYAEARSQAAD